MFWANADCGDPFADNGGIGDYLAMMDVYNIECAFVMPFNDPYMDSRSLKPGAYADRMRLKG